MGMPRIRTENFREQDVYLASLARALAHPARIAILRTLAASQGCLCGEIVDDLPLAQASVSQHLKKLTNAGLISCKNVGASSCYQISPKANAALSALAQQFAQILGPEHRFTNCC
jgi:DNA-binding transcriptional ArsR family regulator